MNSKTFVPAALLLVALAAFVAVRSRREPPPVALTAIPAPAATAEPAVAPPAPRPTAAALEERVRRMEERTRELRLSVEEAGDSEKRRVQENQRLSRQSMAAGYTGRWVTDLQLTDDQRRMTRRLFDRWLEQDEARGEYRRLDRATFEAREAELRAMLTPPQQQARADMVRDLIRDTWQTLACSVSEIRDGREATPLFLGEPSSPASRALGEKLLKHVAELQALNGSEPVPSSSPAPDPALLGDCPPVPDGLLLPDAHDLGILGLWRQAEPKARSILSPEQMKKFSELLPTDENPYFHHGY
jgi:hypothetical protein